MTSFKLTLALCLAVSARSTYAQWAPSNKGMETLTPNSIQQRGSQMWATGFEGLYVSDDGKSWQQKKIETSGNPGFYSFAPLDQTLYVAGLSGCFKSTDNGETWNKLNYDTKIYSISSLGIKDKELYTLNTNGVFLSDLNGQNTQLITTSIKKQTYFDEDGEEHRITSANYVLLRDDITFLCTDNGIYTSKNKGESWEAINKGLPKGKPVIRMFSLNGLLIATSETAGGYISSDNGQQWTRLEGGLPKNPNILAMAASGPALFASIFMKGVFVSTDKGITWKEMNEGLGKKERAFSMMVQDNKLYAGLCDKGIYVYDISRYSGK